MSLPYSPFTMHRNLLSLLASILLVLPSQAQMIVDPTPSVDALVLDIFQGSGVTISGATINGVGGSPTNGAVGHYSYSGSSPIPAEGVILTTGSAQAASYPAGVFASNSNGYYPDWDLNFLAQQNIIDATVLEFNFIPAEDQMMFEYVFASEEYPEFVCSSFNDVFGFFLSGPGITGQYQNNAVNVALLPNSYIPVSINTVNDGMPGTSGQAPICASVDPNWQANNVYYVNNEVGADIVYDGHTTILQVSALVTPGEEHRIKIAVADASDGVYDSAIFLQAASFRSVPSLTTQIARLREAGMVNAWFNDEGALLIDAGEKEIGSVRLLDLNGRLVHQEQVNASGRITLNAIGLPTGAYVLETDSDATVLRARVVKG